MIFKVLCVQTLLLGECIWNELNTQKHQLKDLQKVHAKTATGSSMFSRTTFYFQDPE